MRSVELIAAALGEGAPDRRCRAAPAVLRRWGLGRRLSARGRQVRWGATVRSDLSLLVDGPLAVVAEFSPRLARAVADSIRADRFPVVVGGDHSCAIGTWSGVASVLRPQGSLGLVWVDAHLDSHTLETSYSRMPHGMPLAALLGHGTPELVQVADALPKLVPEQVSLIGARSWEDEEAALLERLGVRVMRAEEVRERGFEACMTEAVERARRGSAGWGLSFDMDALDPVDAPGTGTRVAHGIRLTEVTDAVRGLALDPQLVACEMVEYNPALDEDKRTAAALQQVLDALIDRRSPRRGASADDEPAAALGT